MVCSTEDNTGAQNTSLPFMQGLSSLVRATVLPFALRSSAADREMPDLRALSSAKPFGEPLASLAVGVYAGVSPSFTMFSPPAPATRSADRYIV